MKLVGVRGIWMRESGMVVGIDGAMRSRGNVWSRWNL